MLHVVWSISLSQDNVSGLTILECEGVVGHYIILSTGVCLIASEIEPTLIFLVDPYAFLSR